MMRIDPFSLVYPCVSPSLLAADKGHLELEIERAEEAGASYIHFDVMDGRFVPAVSFFNDELSKPLSATRAVRDVHLMVEHPITEARRFLKMGADIVTLHVEALEKEGIAAEDLPRLLPGALLGVSLKPATPVEALRKYLPFVSLVLLMSVEPGKGGQSFLSESPARARAIRKMIDESGRRVLLSIDGGINAETSKKALASGVDILVAGSYLFGHDDFASRLRSLLDE